MCWLTSALSYFEAFWKTCFDDGCLTITVVSEEKSGPVFPFEIVSDFYDLLIAQYVQKNFTYVYKTNIFGTCVITKSAIKLVFPMFIF